MAEPVADAVERERALDPRTSFIVQAPAGSGKTELLIQRFLRLLSCVAEPEEVMAVTFTRKAAGELRQRVIAALRQAESGIAPAAPHARLSFELASEVLRDERRREWQLQRHPSRLSISTIDSVNTWLASRAPLSRGGGMPPTVTETPELLYREAARATLSWLAEPGDIGRPVGLLLRHLDNDAAKFERLLVAMLPRRDQWLRHVVAARGERSELEAPLRELAAHVLRQAAELLDPVILTELAQLLAFAAGHLPDEKAAAAWVATAGFPPPEAAHLRAWQQLSSGLLTVKGEWRKSVTIREGFPPGTPEKKRIEQVLRDCTGNDELLLRLRAVGELPGTAYAAGQWEILVALLEVLRLAAAELRLVFAARGQADFPEVAAAALDALSDGGDQSDGENDRDNAGERPSELGLALDHRIQHILVDEFQDTSLSQFELLQRLIAGWQPDDGRTLFLVGDPMQSIYRFREAEVGLFMQVRDRGIGWLRPQSLRLRVNFRSRPQVVRWLNETFARTFPRHDDAVMGAVRFADSIAARAAGESADEPAGVEIDWQIVGDPAAEARRVVELVQTARAHSAQQSVCILVRNKAHASRILTALRAAAVDFVAPDLENMEHASAAQDLLALTRALCNPADRLAWIGLLRAPWCGLSLVDLHALLAADHTRAVPELLADAQLLGALSAEGVAAAERLLRVMMRAAAARGRRPLRDLVEGAWLELHGPATLREAAELQTAEAFLELIESADVGGDCLEPVWLGEQMSRRSGTLGSGDPGVQLMTIHKAKGLEFDVVIIPGMGRKPRNDDAPILAWQDVPLGPERSVPILAPIAASGSDGDALHSYLGVLAARKQAYELDRLLYVACTRARQRLHLLGQIEPVLDPRTSARQIRKPHAGSLLHRLWSAVEAQAKLAAESMPLVAATDDQRIWVQPPLRRLPPDWRAPAGAPAVLPRGPATADEALPVVYEWASSWTMQVGVVVHHWLQIIAEEGVDRFDSARIERQRHAFERMLERLGTGRAEMEQAVGRVIDALSATLAHDRGRWLLSAPQAENELAITVPVGASFRQHRIDRTFVDEHGCRWIVDYKTGTHQGGDLEAYLERELTRHGEQLRRYRDALALLWPADEIRTALYFPLLAQFREVRLDR